MNLSVRFKYLLLFAFVCALLELAVFVSDLTLLNKFNFHILISGSCLIAIFSLLPSREKEDLRFIILLTILITFMGPFGAFLAILNIVMYFFYSRNAGNISELLANIFPKHEISRSSFYYDRIIHGLDDFNAESETCEFLDIMSFGTSKQKRLALEKITRYFNPQFAGSLLHALKDKDNQIRVLAATSITTLDQIFFKRYLKLEESLRQDANNKIDILKFALHCDRYYSSKILDPERKEKVLASAILAYEKYFSLEPQHEGVWYALLKLYIFARQPKKTISLFEAYAGGADIPSKIKIIYLNALYEVGDFFRIREFASKNRELRSSPKNKEFIKIARLWRTANG